MCDTITPVLSHPRLFVAIALEMALLASMFSSGLEVVTSLRAIVPQPSRLKAMVDLGVRGTASKDANKDVPGPPLPAGAADAPATPTAEVAVVVVT